MLAPILIVIIFMNQKIMLKTYSVWILLFFDVVMVTQVITIKPSFSDI